MVVRLEINIWSAVRLLKIIKRNWELADTGFVQSFRNSSRQTQIVDLSLLTGAWIIRHQRQWTPFHFHYKFFFFTYRKTRYRRAEDGSIRRKWSLVLNVKVRCKILGTEAAQQATWGKKGENIQGGGQVDALCAITTASVFLQVFGNIGKERCQTSTWMLQGDKAEKGDDVSTIDRKQTHVDLSCANPSFGFLHCSTSLSWSTEGGKKTTHRNLAWAIQITEWNFNPSILLIPELSDANTVRRWEGVTWRRWRRAERGREERRERWIDYMRGRQRTGTALRSSDREPQQQKDRRKKIPHWGNDFVRSASMLPLDSLRFIQLLFLYAVFLKEEALAI